MDIKDLQPIIDLMNQQEERLVKKIDEVHDDVLETKKQATLTNGRLRTAEKDIIEIRSDLKIRQATCFARLEGLTPSIPTIKAINYISKRPRLLLFAFIAGIIVIQGLVMEALNNNWIGHLLNFIKP